MKFNNFLSGTLKFLNIANRAIPLIKDVYPGINKVKNMFKGYQSNNNYKSNEKKDQIKKENNNLTFFK